MANKVICTDKPHEIYNCEEEHKKEQPEFKPGKTPHYFLGDELLNGNVNWLQVLAQILTTGQFTLSMLSEQIGIHAKGLALVLENDLRFLNFRAGATLLAIHERFYPSIEN